MGANCPPLLSSVSTQAMPYLIQLGILLLLGIVVSCALL